MYFNYVILIQIYNSVKNVWKWYLIRKNKKFLLLIHVINVLTSTQRTKKIKNPNYVQYSFQFNPLTIQMILELFVNMDSLLQVVYSKSNINDCLSNNDDQ